VDGLTWKDYEAELERKLEDLQARVPRGAYRAQPSRRVYIPKPDGRERPSPCKNSRAFSHEPVSFAFSRPWRVQNRKNREKFRSARSFTKFRRVSTQPRPIAVAALEDKACPRA
jgi:retron-type reverse transcriptase